MEKERYIGLLKEMAGKYLPAADKKSPEKIFVSGYDHAVIKDLKAIKGRNYGDLKKEDNLASLAADSYDWNKYLVKQKYKISIDSDIKAGKYTEEEAFALMTVYGHKGAVKYLRGEKAIPSAIKEMAGRYHQVADPAPAGANPPPAQKEKEKDDAVVNDKKSAAPVLNDENVTYKVNNNPAPGIDPKGKDNNVAGKKDAAGKVEDQAADEKSMTNTQQYLDEVVIKSGKVEKFQSGRTEAQVRREAKTNLLAASDKFDGLTEGQAENIVKKAVGKDAFTWKSTSRNVPTFMSKDIITYTEYVIDPITRLEAIANTKADNVAGEVEIRTNNGQVTIAQEYLISYFTANRSYPEGFDLKEEIVDGEKRYSLSFTPSMNDVKKYLPKASNEERSALADHVVSMRMKPDYDPKRYDIWCEWKKTDANGLSADYRYEMRKGAINLQTHNQFFDQTVENNGSSLSALNDALIDQKHIGIKDAREYKINSALGSVDTKEGLAAIGRLSQAKKEVSLLERMQDREGKYANAIHQFAKINLLYANQELLKAKFDVDVIRATSQDDKKDLAQKYNRDKEQLDRKINNFTTAEKKKAFLGMDDAITEFKGDDRQKVEDIYDKNEPRANEFQKINQVNEIRADNPRPVDVVTLSGGSTSSPTGKGAIADLQVDHSSHTAFGPVNLDINADVSTAVVTNHGDKDETKYFSPYEFNDYTKKSQDAKVGLTYFENNRTSTSLTGTLLKNNAGTTNDITLRQNFKSIRGDNAFVGLTGPGLMENPIEKIDTRYGVTFGGDKAVFLGGDRVVLSGAAKVQAADYQTTIMPAVRSDAPAIPQKIEAKDQLLTTGAIGAKYTYKDLTIAGNATYTKLNLLNNDGVTTDITTVGVKASNTFKFAEVKIGANFYFTPQFSLQNYNASASFNTGAVNHTLYGGYTKIDVKAPNMFNQQDQIFNAGYKFNINSNNKLLNGTFLGVEWMDAKSTSPLTPTVTPFRISLSRAIQW